MQGYADHYDEGTLDDFLAADTFEAAALFLRKHPMLYGGETEKLVKLYRDEPLSAGATMEARHVLAVALWLYAQGRSVNETAAARLCGGFAANPLRRSSIALFPGDGGEWFFELKTSLNPYTETLAEYAERSAGVCFAWADGRSGLYTMPLDAAGPEMRSFFDNLETAAEEPGRSRLDFGSIIGMAADAAALADALMTLHLAGIRTIAEGRDEARAADSGISALWWLALDRMRGGRVFQCEACGKVCTARKERGKWKKRFCSDACKQWRSKHGARDAGGGYSEWLPPRR